MAESNSDPSAFDQEMRRFGERAVAELMAQRPGEARLGLLVRILRVSREEAQPFAVHFRDAAIRALDARGWIDEGGALTGKGLQELGVAEAIAEEMFVNRRTGEKGDRLVLTAADGRRIGWWTKEAVAHMLAVTVDLARQVRDA